jgi:hypothetical protein
MNLIRRDSLLFASAILVHRGHRQVIEDLLVDTGSATTLLSIDAVAALRIHPEPNDSMYRIRGVGGVEYVFARTMDAIIIDGHETHRIDIGFGALDYGFDMNGILGLDVLLSANAVIDLKRLTIKCSSENC